MKKISAVMTVYNEERFLPAVLKNIYPHVHEIVIVDGGPYGPSTDSTKEIAKSCDKVQYQSGKFATLDGAWDIAGQRNKAISGADADFLLMVSADMFFLNLEWLCKAVEDESCKLLFCTTFEFWMDTKHLRMQFDDRSLMTIPSTMTEVVAVERSLNPLYDESAQLVLEKASLEDRKIIPQMAKFHLGFIRPFQEQVEKHKRHVRQHRWPSQEKLLQGSARNLQQWAMLHVLSYGESPKIAWQGEVPLEMEPFMDMECTSGAGECVKEFERIHGASIFKTGKEVGT